jgi:hypothetical protein
VRNATLLGLPTIQPCPPPHTPEGGVGQTQEWMPAFMLAFPRWYEFGERRWNDTDIDKGKPKNSEKNLSQCHFFHHKFPTLTRARTRASTVKGRRLTTWAIARPCTTMLLNTIKNASTRLNSALYPKHVVLVVHIYRVRPCLWTEATNGPIARSNVSVAYQLQLCSQESRWRGD